MSLRLVISFILNLPWTLVGLGLAVLSGPYKLKIDRETLALIFYVKSFWWYKWLPGKGGVRAIANGHAIQLSPSSLKNDLAHELIHVKQAIREPLLHPIFYAIQSLKYGYRNNKYEIEAYKDSQSIYISE